MQLDTRGYCLNNVREILWFLTAHTERPHMERAVRTDFLPNPSKEGVIKIKGATEAIFGSVGTLLEVP
eukprot:2166856-Amphidinium_carterae.1